MSALEDARRNPIGQASLANLFPPSPRRGALPLSRAQGSSSRTLSALAAAPPPDSSPARAAIIDPAAANASAAPDSGPAHAGTRASAGRKTRAGEREDELSLAEIKWAARGRLREIRCPWRDEVKNGTKHCDAVLASYNLFRKHTKRHCQKAHEAKTARDENENGQATRCGWPGCEWETARGVTHLELHVAKEHLRELQDAFCPFKDCFAPDLTVDEHSSDDHYRHLGHPHPWSTRSLRPSPVNLAQNTTSLPALPPLPESATIDPYLVHAQPYRDRPPAVLLPSRRGRPGPSPCSTPPPALRDLRESIVPLPFYREDYFTPTNKDAPVGYFHSWSFFRHPFTHLPDRTLHPDDNTYYVLRDRRKVSAEALRRSMRGDGGGAAGDSGAGVSPLDGLRPPGACPASSAVMAPVARPKRGYDRVIPLRAPLCAMHPAAKRGKKRALGENQEVLKNSTPEVAPTQKDDKTTTTTAQKRFAHVQVIKASKRYAQRKAKMSFGFDHWVERLKFEKRGNELGECALDF